MLCYFDWKEETGFGYCNVGEWVSSRQLPLSGDTIKCITELCSGGNFKERSPGLKEVIRVLLCKEGRIKIIMITCLSQSGRLQYVLYSMFKKNLLINNSKSVLVTTTNRSQCGIEKHKFLYSLSCVRFDFCLLAISMQKKFLWYRPRVL